MAEFPYPEYRNLWRGSKLSQDRSALSTNAWSDGGKQVDDGLEVTITSESAGAQSPAYTTSGYRVDVVAGEAYSLAVPVKNGGAVQFPVRITAYFDPSGWATSGVRWVQPGETTVIKIENMVAPNDGTIRFSWRVDADDPRLPVSGKLTLLDGITIVQSATAPPFPFNGDGAMPVETLKRRNLAKNPLGPNMENVDNWRWSAGDTFGTALDGGRQVAELIEGGSATSLYADPTDNFSPPAGTKIHALADVKVLGDSGASMRLRFPGYSGSSIADSISVPDAPQVTTDGWLTYEVNATVEAMPDGAYTRGLVYPGTGSVMFWEAGSGYRIRNYLVEYDTIGPYFDGDTPASGNISHRWAPDGTSLEVETINPPAGRTTVWDGEPYKSTSTLWVGPASGVTGVFEVGASTEARLGIVSDIYSRSREKIQLKLAGVDDLVRSGHRIELAAAAMTSTPAVWHWRQVTGPTVALSVKENTCDFIAPDVERSTRIRIGVYAASEDGANRSDWHYFDLDVEPPMLRFRGGDDGDFSPRSPYLVGYSRGKREIWNDVIRPATYEKNPRHELEVLDLGIPDDDVAFSTTTPKRMAAGGVWVNPETGDVFRNFGAGYNETDDTTASPRTSTYWVNPANGDILEWIED